MGAIELGLLSSQKRAIGELDSSKLSAPETAGTANQVLTSDGNGGQVWADIGTGEITVDSTLSVSGAAADAKATGDEISDIKSAVNGKEDELLLSYVTVLDATITTVDDGEHSYPYATYQTISLSEQNRYRITVDGVETECSVGVWATPTSTGVKGYAFVGNVALYDANAINVINNDSTKTYCIAYNTDQYNGLQILTTVAGSHSIKIERVVYSKAKYPNTLIYGNDETPINRKYNGNTSYQSIEIGHNSSSARGTIAIGSYNDIKKQFGIAIGFANVVDADNATAIGEQNNVTASNAVAFGSKNTASGMSAHAEGILTTASGKNSHAEGDGTTASGMDSHAEGLQSVASANYAHAEGYMTQAKKSYSHSEGGSTIANGNCSHAEGYGSEADATCAHAEGINTIAGSANQHVQGKYNVSDVSAVYADIVGNGADDNTRSNAFALTWTGDGRFNGNVYVGCNADSTGGTRIPHDIQMDGTSILNQGVANIVSADASYVKGGTNSDRLLVPSRQHEAVYYGLAKLAGADMALVTGETVGVYPDAQKIAIQKMLGIYEAPWELIREDTVTNATETDVEITVDDDGNAYELTDVYMQVWTPQQETAASIGDYGQVRSYYDSSNYITSQMNTWSQAANAAARYAQVLLENKNGAILNIVTQNATQYSTVGLMGRTNIPNSDALLNIGTFAFDKIVIKKVTGTVQYKLYGKRKWN